MSRLLARDRRLLPALERIARTSRSMPIGYAGTRLHKVNPNTVAALEDRGWITTRYENRLLVARPTQLGRDLIQETTDKEENHV